MIQLKISKTLLACLTAGLMLSGCATTHAPEVANAAKYLNPGGRKLVQKLSGPAASWFFDPATERAKHLLGQPARIPLPMKKALLTVILLAVSAVIVLVPIKKSVSSLFIDHDKTCVLRSGHR